MGGDRQTNRKRLTTGRKLERAVAERETHKENYRQSLQRNRRVKTCTHAHTYARTHHTTTTTTKHTHTRARTRARVRTHARTHTHTHICARALRLIQLRAVITIHKQTLNTVSPIRRQFKCFWYHSILIHPISPTTASGQEPGRDKQPGIAGKHPTRKRPLCQSGANQQPMYDPREANGCWVWRRQIGKSLAARAMPLSSFYL